jgi:hypothetical protein
MGLASYYFTKNVDRTWRLLENLEAGMIGMNTGKPSKRGLNRHDIDCKKVTPRLPSRHLVVSRNRVMEKSLEKMLPSMST